MTIVVAAVSLYPVVAESIPNPLKGSSQSLPDTLAFHFASAESAFGIPMRAFAEIVVGFIVFGVALNFTGGGRFFNDLAFALVGRFRGGAAQVGIISSRAAGLDLRQRDLERGQLRRRHDPGDEAHRLHAPPMPAPSRRSPRPAPC